MYSTLPIEILCRDLLCSVLRENPTSPRISIDCIESGLNVNGLWRVLTRIEKEMGSDFQRGRWCADLMHVSSSSNSPRHRQLL